MADEFWSDDKIYQAAKAEWMSILLQLWEAYGKQPDPKQLKVYVKQLGDLPMQTLEKTVAVLLREHKFNSVPTIAEIWAVVKQLNGDQDTVTAQTKPWCFKFTKLGLEIL
jgi:hypothetical protein